MSCKEISTQTIEIKTSLTSTGTSTEENANISEPGEGKIFDYKGKTRKEVLAYKFKHALHISSCTIIHPTNRRSVICLVAYSLSAILSSYFYIKNIRVLSSFQFLPYLGVHLVYRSNWQFLNDICLTKLAGKMNSEL